MAGTKTLTPPKEQVIGLQSALNQAQVHTLEGKLKEISLKIPVKRVATYIWGNAHWKDATVGIFSGNGRLYAITCDEHLVSFVDLDSKAEPNPKAPHSPPDVPYKRDMGSDTSVVFDADAEGSIANIYLPKEHIDLVAYHGTMEELSKHPFLIPEAPRTEQAQQNPPAAALREDPITHPRTVKGIPIV